MENVISQSIINAIDLKASGTPKPDSEHSEWFPPTVIYTISPLQRFATAMSPQCFEEFTALIRTVRDT